MAEDLGASDARLIDLAHKLNELLTVMLFSIEQLGRQPLDTRGQEQLARVEQSVQQAAQLVEQITAHDREGMK